VLRSNRAIHLGKRDPKFVDHPIRVEAEMRCRLKLGDEGVLDQFRTKTSPGWFPYGRPALFNPSQQEAITTICHSCFDIHPSGRARESTVFYGIGAKFIQNHGERECCGGRHFDIGASHLDSAVQPPL